MDSVTQLTNYAAPPCSFLPKTISANYQSFLEFHEPEKVWRIPDFYSNDGSLLFTADSLV